MLQRYLGEYLQQEFSPNGQVAEEQYRYRTALLIQNCPHFYLLTEDYWILSFVVGLFSFWVNLGTGRKCFSRLCRVRLTHWYLLLTVNNKVSQLQFSWRVFYLKSKKLLAILQYHVTMISRAILFTNSVVCGVLGVKKFIMIHNQCLFWCHFSCKLKHNYACYIHCNCSLSNCWKLVND